MRSLSRAATAAGLIGFALAIVLGAFVGVRAGTNASEPEVRELRIADPDLFAGPPAGARQSAGGFTGFGGASLAGEVINGGELVSVEAIDPEAGGGGRLVFRDQGHETSVRYLNGTRLFELAAGSELNEGDAVVLRIVDGVVVGVLRIPPDAIEPDTPAAE
jgi:hypothetical protein